MSLTLALNNALSGLRLNQNAMSVLSQNLANVNTEGYSRQYIAQSALYNGGTGNGVKIDGILRRVDNYLLRAVQSQGSELQRISVINDYQSRVQTLLGQPGAGNSLDSTLTTFFNVLQQLADAPDSSASRRTVLSTAEALATQISSLAASLEDLRFQADRDIQASVDIINAQITKLYQLNSSIAEASVNNQPVAGLLDERDAALRTLAEQMDISVLYNEYGGVNITAGNGIALVDDVQRQLIFESATSINVFTNDERLGAISVQAYDNNGNPIGNPDVLVTGDVSSEVESNISSGKIGGLLQLRDDMLPLVLIELDNLAAGLRDAMNAVQNSGTSFPPPESFTGTREVKAGDQYNWSGSIRIAVLNADGSPLPAQFSDEDYTGLRPLTLDLSTLNSGDGDGFVTVQTIIDEINNHFHPPTAKVVLGDLNNIQLVSDVDALPTVGGLFDFDFELENIAAGDAQFFITDITVLDDGANDITSVTEPAYTVNLSDVGTYTTVTGSQDVTIELESIPDGLQIGDTIYLSAPSVLDVNGIDPAELTGFMVVQEIDGDSIVVTTNGTATSDGTVNDGTPGTLQPPVTVAGGTKMRSNENGNLQVDLAGNPASDFFDITVTVTVVNADGTQSNSDITYRVLNNATNTLNDRYSATAATGDGVHSVPSTNNIALRAMLVDENGNELPKVNGEYVSLDGYLRITSTSEDYGVVIDSLDSSQDGNPDDNPPDDGTGRGFAFFFELNNFFASNAPTNTGDTIKNSALNFRLEDRILADANLIATGKMTQSRQPADENDPPQYTYELFAGDNTVAAAFADLRNAEINFTAVGEMPAAGVTLSVYTSYFLSSASGRAQEAEEQYDTALTFYEEFRSQADAVSGVNLDEELANTVILQNAYSATARVITVINQMFGELLSSVGG